MSRFAVIPATALADTRLAYRDVLVLAALGTHTNKEGWCFPGSDSIGEMLGVSGSRVRQSMKALADLGYIEKQARRREDGGQTSNLIRVLFDTIHPTSALRGGVSPELTGGVSPELTGGVSPELTGGVSPELTRKLPVESSQLKALPCSDYPPDFEKLWASYPKRAGSHSKREAFKQWRARLKQSHSADAMQLGVDAYYAHLAATGKIGTEYVKMAATFLGPNLHFLDEYAAPVEQAPAKSAMLTAIENLAFGGRDELDEAGTEHGYRPARGALPSPHAAG